MMMADLRKRLLKDGFFVSPASIRTAQERGTLPEAARDWCGRRVFSETHVKAIKAWLGSRKSTSRKTGGRV